VQARDGLGGQRRFSRDGDSDGDALALRMHAGALNLGQGQPFLAQA